MEENGGRVDFEVKRDSIDVNHGVDGLWGVCWTRFMEDIDGVID
jgi:hypothetical protein